MDNEETTKEEAEERQKSILEATTQAIEVPLSLAKQSLEALEKVMFILKIGNPQTTSDSGVACLALASGIEGAVYNVMINLSGLESKNEIDSYKKESIRIISKTKDLRENILNEVWQRIT